MNPDSLEAFGFREHPVPVVWKCDRFWQYAATDQIGKQFAVNVRLWRHPSRDGWDAQSQMHDDDGRSFESLLISVAKMTPAEVVAWFERLWCKLNCQYESRFDDE